MVPSIRHHIATTRKHNAEQVLSLRLGTVEVKKSRPTLVAPRGMMLFVKRYDDPFALTLSSWGLEFLRLPEAADVFG